MPFTDRSSLPLSFAIPSTAICEAAIAGSVTEGVPKELPGLRSGPRVIDGNYILSCEPALITLWLEFPYKNVH